MSWLSYSSELGPGWTSSLYNGLGASGAEIASIVASGETGPGPLSYFILQTANEYYWTLVSSDLNGGVLVLNEDTSFTFTPAMSGVTTFTYRLFENGVALTPDITITLTSLPSFPSNPYPLMFGVTQLGQLVFVL